MNPDDYFDMMADLDMWRQEAASIQAAIDSGEIVLPQLHVRGCQLPV